MFSDIISLLLLLSILILNMFWYLGMVEEVFIKCNAHLGTRKARLTLVSV